MALLDLQGMDPRAVSMSPGSEVSLLVCPDSATSVQLCWRSDLSVMLCA